MSTSVRSSSKQKRLGSGFYLALLGVALLTVALVVRSGMLARKNSGAPMSATMREVAEGKPELSASDAAMIAEKYPEARKLASGLMYVSKAVGSGLDQPRFGAKVTAHYDGRLLDGTQFDSSFKKGEPITFTVGTGAVIKGWDEAFLDMRRGEKRTLIIPYWLGYGIHGKAPRIPGRATLVFEVELIDFR